MVPYQLDFVVPSPGQSISVIEFSPDGRFLAVGDRDSSVLYILDRLAGFHPTISAVTLPKPTALAWETSTAFYVGSSDGRFCHYRIDLEGGKLVQGFVNSRFYGQFPITAIALNEESNILALSLGPDILMFQRICATGASYSLKTTAVNLRYSRCIPFYRRGIRALQFQKGPRESSSSIPEIALFRP
jgi:WD40 repeat protein